METQPTNSEFLDNPEQFVDNLSEPIIITWGFRPAEDAEHILFLRSRGFFHVWLDGNRIASLRAFRQRGDIPESLYHLQILNIENTRILQQIEPHAQVNPFQSNGIFRPVQEIAQELLRLLPQ